MFFRTNALRSSVRWVACYFVVAILVGALGYLTLPTVRDAILSRTALPSLFWLYAMSTGVLGYSRRMYKELDALPPSSSLKLSIAMQLFLGLQVTGWMQAGFVVVTYCLSPYWSDDALLTVFWWTTCTALVIGLIFAVGSHKPNRTYTRRG